MSLVGLDVYESDYISQFRFDLPVTSINFVGLPNSHYFQGDFTPQSFVPAPEIAWFKTKETGYVSQLLKYEWDSDPEQNAPKDLKYLHHLKSKPAQQPVGVPRELFWKARRDQTFGKNLRFAQRGADAIERSGNFGDKSYSMQDFLKTRAFNAKGYCTKCAEDSDEVFVFRQLNGYRNGKHYTPD